MNPEWTPEYIYEVFSKEFPGSTIDVDWRPRYRNNVIVSRWAIVGVRFLPVNGNEKGDYYCHGIDDAPDSGWKKLHSIEELVDVFRKMYEYHKRQPKHYIPREYPTSTRTPRQIQQLEFEASADISNNEFEVCLRSLLEEQLGAQKVTTERVNRYLGMSRGKMYLLLEGIGCKAEKIEQLKKLDV